MIITVIYISIYSYIHFSEITEYIGDNIKTTIFYSVSGFVFLIFFVFLLRKMKLAH